MCNFTLSRVKIHKKVKICNFCTKILNNFKQYQQSWLLIKCQKYCSIYTYHNKQSFFISLCLGLLLRQNTPDRDTASRSFFIILHALLHFPQARLCLLYPKAVFSLSCRGFPRLWGNIKTLRAMRSVLYVLLSVFNNLKHRRKLRQHFCAD